MELVRVEIDEVKGYKLVLSKELVTLMNMLRISGLNDYLYTGRYASDHRESNRY